MAIIKWLHVSDLHLNIDGVENRRLRKNSLSICKISLFSATTFFVLVI